MSSTTMKTAKKIFSYWRSDSPAKRMFDDTAGDDLLNQLEAFDVFYFSGITLAILNEAGRKKFIHFIHQQTRLGKSVVIDTNYRQRLWASPQAAVQPFTQSMQAASHILTSYEDLSSIWPNASINDLQQHLEQLAKPIDGNSECEKEIVFRISSDRILIKTKHHLMETTTQQAHGWQQINLKPLNQVVDSTAAGDSFNAAYLIARLNGQGIEEAIHHAHQLACLVISHRGAIIDSQLMEHLKANFQMH